MPLTDGKGRTDEQERRKRNLLIIGVILVLLIVATVFEVGIRAPQIPFASNLIVFALFNLNLIVFLLLLVLLFRNLVKLSFEHRHKVIGARFKAKLVLTFLALALIPGILIFIIASNFITTSIEGWFKPQVERPLDQAMEVAQTYYQTLEATALRHARYMARTVEKNELLGDAKPEELAAYLTEQQDRLGVASITVFDARGERVRVRNEGLPSSIPTSETNHEHMRQALTGHEITTVHELDSGDMIQAVVPIRDRQDGSVVAAMVVGIHVPHRLEARLRGISQAFQEYKQLKLLKNPIKGIYILLFLLMTLIIVFSATWFGLYLARGITEPIQKLAEGTREVASGNLRYKVEVRADDEIGILVDSFNRMVATMARNGTDFGIRVAGLGDRWFTAPVNVPQGLYFPRFGPDDANPDIGDSAIVETIGLGGFAMAASPAVAGFVGQGGLAEAIAVTEEMAEICLTEHAHFRIPTLGDRGSPVGIDIRKVVETGITPLINTGIAGKVPGTGQIGAGVVRAPLACFEQALEAFARG